MPQTFYAEYFLNVEGHKGECQAVDFKDTFQLLTWNFQCRNPGSPTVGSGTGIGKSIPSDISCTQPVNSGSPKLWQSCADGIPINKIKLTCRKGGTKGKLKYLEITFTHCIISSYHINAFNSNEDLPSETFSFSYAKVEYNYTVQQPDGKSGGTVPGVYDFMKNVSEA